MEKRGDFPKLFTEMGEVGVPSLGLFSPDAFDGHVGNRDGLFGGGCSSNHGCDDASMAVILLPGSYVKSLFIRSSPVSVNIGNLLLKKLYGCLFANDIIL